MTETKTVNPIVIPGPKNPKEFIAIDPLKVTPLDCRLVVRLVDCGNVTKGGIFLVGEDKNKTLVLAEVLKVGDGRTTDHGVHIDVRAKVGDHVLIGRFAGQKLGRTDEIKIINEVEIYGFHGKD